LKDSYLMTKEIADGMVRIAALTDRLRHAAVLRALNAAIELDANAKRLDLAKRAAEYDERTAQAAADLEKEQIRAAHYAENLIQTKESELELNKKLLAVDLARAEAALLLAQRQLGSESDVAKAESALAEFEIKASKTYAADAANIKRADESTRMKMGFLSSDFNPEDRKKRNAALAEATQQQEENNARLWEERRQLQKELDEAKRRTDQAAIDKAAAEVQRIQNEMNKPQPEVPGKGVPATDALLGVGNFLGAGRGLIGNIQQQQLEDQRQTNVHLDNHGRTLGRIENKLGTTSGNTIEVPE
jgi:hypothetical protein